jgi:single-stranded-DNA-specific exonuclease
MAITENNIENPSIVGKTVVWDSSSLRLFSLEDFCKNEENARANKSSLENNCLNPPILGIIVGIPFTRDDLRFGLESILSLGVRQIAFTEFEPRSELELQKRSAYLSRQELAQKYRFFLKLAKSENPFWWKPLESEQNSLEALKIFEELGLVRYLGSSDLFVIELLPSEKKLDLELSLRYASLRRYWERVIQFQNYLLDISWEEIMFLVERIVKEEIF